MKSASSCTGVLDKAIGSAYQPSSPAPRPGDFGVLIKFSESALIDLEISGVRGLTRVLHMSRFPEVRLVPKQSELLILHHVPYRNCRIS